MRGREDSSHCCSELNVQLLPIGPAGTSLAKALGALTGPPHSRQPPPSATSLGTRVFLSQPPSQSPPGNVLGSPRGITAENDSRQPNGWRRLTELAAGGRVGEGTLGQAVKLRFGNHLPWVFLKGQIHGEHHSGWLG